MIRLVLSSLLAVGGCAASRPPAEASPPMASSPATQIPADSAPTDTAGTPTRIALGATARIGEHSVQFAAVEEDSRCPADVTCVWAGRARVRLVVDGSPVVLTVPHGVQGEDEPSSATQGGLTVEAVGLHPYPGGPDATPDVPVEVEIVTRDA